MKGKNNMNIKNFCKSNKASIMIWSGVAGLFSATIATIPMTMKATRALDKKKAETGKNKLGFKDTFKTVWKYYIPTAACTAVSIPLIALGNKEYGKKIVAYATYATATATSLQELRNKIPEIVGKDNAEKITKSVAQSHVDKLPENKTIVVTGKGKTLFYEPITNQLFESDIQAIDKIANQLTAELKDSFNGEIEFTQFLGRLGLSGTGFTDNLVWSNSRSALKGVVEVDYDVTSSKDGQACFVLNYHNLALRESNDNLNYDWYTRCYECL